MRRIGCLSVTGVADYVYDGHGRRVKETDTADRDSLPEIGVYSRSGQKLYRTRDKDSGSRVATRITTRNIYLAGSLIASHDSVNGIAQLPTYLHTDALGSVVADSDSTGAILKRYRYAPYGESLNLAFGTFMNGLGYTGHDMDADTGLTYMQQRYYDPVIGRFLSVDPVGADANSGGNFNRYWYANNNPYKFVDPDGRRARASICERTPARCKAVIPVNPSSPARSAAAKAKGSECEECDEVRATRAGIMRDGGEKLKEAGTYAAKEGAWMLAGGSIGKLLGKVGRILGFAGKEVLIGTKIEAQLGKRGWTKTLVDDAVANPARTVVTRDTRHLPGGGRMDDAATAYYGRNGGYVVRNDQTGDIVQVSDRLDSRWVAPWD